MLHVSLCGCLRREIWSDKAFHAFSDLMARHYHDNPECDRKAEQDPVWQMRRPIPKEIADAG